MRRLLDSQGGVITEFIGDETDTIHIRRVMDAESIVEGNKARQTEDDTYTPSRDIQHRASIPVVVYERWLKEGMPAYDKQERVKFINKKLRDPANRHLLTTHGRTRFRRGYE